MQTKSSEAKPVLGAWWLQPPEPSGEWETLHRIILRPGSTNYHNIWRIPKETKQFLYKDSKKKPYIQWILFDSSSQSQILQNLDDF